MLQKIVCIAAFILIASCHVDTSQNNQSQLFLRKMNPSEIHDDFEQLVKSVKEFYGPLEYKELRFGFDINAIINKYKQDLDAAKSENEVFGIYSKFLATFKDAHVGIRFFDYNHHIQTYSAGMMIVPFKNEQGEMKAYLASKDADLEENGVNLWDELVTIDNKDTMSYLDTILSYQNLGNDKSNYHLIYKALERSSYMTDLTPTANSTRLVFRKNDDSLVTVDRVWRLKQPLHVSFINNRLFAKLEPIVTQASYGNLRITINGSFILIVV